MIKKILLNIFLVFLAFAIVIATAVCAEKKETTEAEDTVSEFKETKFLQIDKVDIPKELQRIEAQIKQNAMDVIISSKTHTPVYAQKRDTGYSESYKKFHGLDIQIVPIPGEQDFFSLTYFYYNWTNRKFDKHLRRRISKYNVLNEMRFGLYELLLGKKFVEDHKDEIEKQNFDRIQAVRENEESQARIDRKKKKQLKKQLEEEARKKTEEEEKKKDKLSRGEAVKKEKNSEQLTTDGNQETATTSPNIIPPNNDDEIDDIKSDDPDRPKKLKERAEAKKKAQKKITPVKEGKEENTATPEPPVIPSPEISETIPTISSLYAFGNFFADNNTSDGLLHTGTHLRYVGFGVRYINEQETVAMPRGMRFSLRVGLPIKKDNYTFPIYRAFEIEMYKRKILGYFQVLAGLDYSPVYFVNLPGPGENLQVFENDVFWFKTGIGFNQDFFGKTVDLRAIYLMSLMVKSNQKKSIGGTSMVFSAYYQHNKTHGAEVAWQQTSMVGDLSVASQSLFFSYIYKFEN
jgi:hypothetical protein